MNLFLATLGLAVGLALLATLVQWVALRAAGVGVEKLIVFYGRELVSLPWFGSRLVIGCIPTGGSVKFDLPRFSQMPLVIRLAVLLSGPASLLGVAVVLLGGGLGWQHFSSGFAQLIQGALHPVTVGVELLQKLEVIFSASILALAGVVAAKCAAFNLLPLGALTGARCIREVLAPDPENRWFNGFESVSMIAVLAMLGLWGTVWWRYVAG